MPSLTLSDRLIWFAHCPKAGGTSVEQFMVARWGDAVGHLHWGWDLWWRRGGWRLADPPNSPQHLVWDDAAAALPRRPDTIFAMVRDPVARMASEHRWQRRGRRGTLAGKALAWLPFPLWIRLMLATARHHPHAFDNHFRPQADFIPPEAHVFRLEDGLVPVLDWLAEAAGDAGGETAAHTAIPHAIPTGKRTPVGAGEAVLIGRAFAVDYRRFGYAPPRDAPGCGGLPDLLIGPLADLLAPLIARADRQGAL